MALKLPQQQFRRDCLATHPDSGCTGAGAGPTPFSRNGPRGKVSIIAKPRPQRAASAPISSAQGGHQGRSLLLPSNCWGTGGERGGGVIRTDRPPPSRKGPGEARDWPRRRRPHRGRGQARDRPPPRLLSLLTVEYAEVGGTHAPRPGVGLRRPPPPQPGRMRLLKLGGSAAKRRGLARVGGAAHPGVGLAKLGSETGFVCAGSAPRTSERVPCLSWASPGRWLVPVAETSWPPG